MVYLKDTSKINFKLIFDFQAKYSFVKYGAPIIILIKTDPYSVKNMDPRHCYFFFVGICIAMYERGRLLRPISTILKSNCGFSTVP